MSKRKKGKKRPTDTEALEEKTLNSDTEATSEIEEAADLETVEEAEAKSAELIDEPLQSEIERLQSEVDEYLDGWQRSRAEFANFKKRIEKERDTARARISADILTHYLEIMDDLERALKDRPDQDTENTWAEGIELIFLKLKALLETEGVEPIQAEGEVFDPNFHEAISYEDSDTYQDGQVIEVTQKGYKIGDRVLRPASVRVAK